MKKRRVLVISQEGSLPPEEPQGASDQEAEVWKTAFDVIANLEWLGHSVEKLGVSDELAPIRAALESFKPHVTFNLVEAFKGLVVYDQHVVSYLELMRAPYTGCNPRGLMIARDKSLSKKLLTYHRIAVPEHQVFRMGRKVRRSSRLSFPLIVKSLVEDASVGISQASLVHSDEKLEERVRFVHESIRTDAIVEEFIDGRELYVPVIGNVRVQVLPTWELVMDKLPDSAPRIATEKAKFDLDYQEKRGIFHTQAKDLDPELERALPKLCRRIYRILNLEGYARLDFRLSNEGKLYFLEANPNPEIAEDEEVACSAAAAGISYDQLIQKILNLGLRRTPAS